MSDNTHYMRHALTLAERGLGCVSPNPMVGCVIVRDNAIVGEGWHRGAGLPHAEVEALSDAGSLARGADVYVTLEPCSHHGRTPPCTNALVAAGVRHVEYAVSDPNPDAEGGAAILEQQGISTGAGLCANEARYQNRVFLHQLQSPRPYVVTKFASSLDGRSATRSGHSQWITGPEARQRGHRIRQAVDAILVGADTVIADDPQLTVRLPDLNPDTLVHPLRVVLDSQGRIPLDRRVFDPGTPGKTLLVSTDKLAPHIQRDVESRGIDVLIVPTDADGRASLDALLLILRQRDVYSVLVEGGPTLLGSCFDAGCVDEVFAFIAPMILGGEDALPAIAGLGSDQLSDACRFDHWTSELIGSDLLIRGEVKHAHTSMTSATSNAIAGVT